ncbi:hypothetical protein GOV12_01955 [Candidatus Pacearchaeota archaeon]|nr:hypothetical protein [Candidatus Pacearchaeota archaeon]
MLKNKKAQSEIITTVLIILLVLAAVVIVWQVVSRTMGSAQKGIDDEERCRGIILTVKKAMAGGGTCTYTDDGDPTTAACTTFAKDGSTGYCPQADIGCLLDTGNPAGEYTPDTANKPYDLTISRDQGNADTFEVKGSVYIQKKSQSEWTFLGDTVGIEAVKEQPLTGVGTTIEVGDSLRVTPKLIDNDHLCGAQSAIKGVTVYSA